MNTPGSSDSTETITLRDNVPINKELTKKLESTLKQTYKAEAYIVPTVNSPALRIDNKIDECIVNRLKITDEHLSESDTSNEKKAPFILHNVEFAKSSAKSNKSTDEKIAEKHMSEITLDYTLFEEDEHCDKEELIENFCSRNKSPDVAQNLKFEAPNQLSIGSQETLYPSRQFGKTNSLPDIDERSEYSVSNKSQSNFCQRRSGCTATFVPPEEISLEIFERNCLKKLEILQHRETEVTEREINVRKKEKEVFMMQKELRIAARVLNEKLKQVDQYLRYQRNRIQQVVDRELIEVARALSDELQKHDELEVSNEHQYRVRDSDEVKRSCAHQGEKPNEFEFGGINMVDEIAKFTEFTKLNEIGKSNEAKESDEFKSDRIEKCCAHKISDEHPYRAEKSDEFESGEVKKFNEFVKRDEVRKSNDERLEESDEFEKSSGELKESSDDFKINKSMKAGRWRNSQSLIDTCEEKGPDMKIRRSLRSRVHSSSSRQSCSSTLANPGIRTYSSLKYKERPKISYDDLNSTLSADPGDSSFVRTSEQFLPHVYKKPSAFTRLASARCTKRNDSAIVSKPRETIDVEEKPDSGIEEKKVLRRFSENIQASRDKDTKFQHYGLVDHTPRDIQATAECNSHNQRVSSYLNLEVDKHVRCKPDSVSTTRPNSCNIEMNEWLQKKRLAYTLATTKPPSNNKENLECDTVAGRDKRSSKKKKKRFTIFG